MQHFRRGRLDLPRQLRWNRGLGHFVSRGIRGHVNHHELAASQHGVLAHLAEIEFVSQRTTALLGDQIREQLMAESPEYQRLREEHSRYATQLEQLSAKSFLSEQEQVEEVRLKKLKLRAKDRMEILVQKARTA